VSVAAFNKLLVDTYNTLYETGKVDGVEVLPDATRKLFKNGYGLMWCDEMRFLLARALSSMNNGLDLNINLNKFDAILNYIIVMNEDKFKTASTIFNTPSGSNKKEMFDAWLIQFVNSNDFLMGCGQGYKGFGEVVPSTGTAVIGGSDQAVYDAGLDKIGALENVSDTAPQDDGYDGGGRATSGPKTAAKAAKARRKRRNGASKTQ
jgi:hypothetical protein